MFETIRSEINGNIACVTVNRPKAMNALNSQVLDELYEAFAEIEKNEVRYESFMMEDAEYCVVAFGIAARVSKNAVVAARREGLKVGLIRPITLWPFPKQALSDAAKHVKGFLSVELSMGQMVEDVKLAIDCSRKVALCRRTGGMIMSSDEVLEQIRLLAGGDNA